MADGFSSSKLGKIPPQSCDTFAALPPATLDNCIIFGKNSDRPAKEVQEIVYFPAQDYPENSKLKCTYIEIDQAPHTYAVILSKPAWMWGAEMGANEHGVCIGNEAVWTRVPDEDSLPKLLGMDLLRLALERGKTASESLKIIVSLLETYGMGGNCSDTIKDFNYHNSFLIADPSEVWILECAGKIWAAERVNGSTRNISNQLTIHTKIDLSCKELEAFAQKGGYWDPSDGPLDFQLAFAEDDMDTLRFKVGRQLLGKLSEQGTFSAVDMFKILRDKNSTICMTNSDFVTTSSQVSVLRKTESGFKCCHWFTGTLDPSTSIFKPFFFCQEVSFPEEVVSPVPDPDDDETDRKHRLYKLHEDVWTRLRRYDDVMCRRLNDLEEKYLGLANEMAPVSADENLSKDLFKKAVEEECLLLI